MISFFREHLYPPVIICFCVTRLDCCFFIFVFIFLVIVLELINIFRVKLHYNDFLYSIFTQYVIIMIERSFMIYLHNSF